MLQSNSSARCSSLFVLATIGATLLLTAGCQTMQPSPDPGSATLSRELEETRREIEELKHRLSVVQFMVDSHERAISDLERGSASSERPMIARGISPQGSMTGSASIQEEPMTSVPAAKVTPAKPKKGVRVNTNPADLASKTYTRAFAALKAKDYEKSLLLFRETAEKWPDDNLADNAIYWAGEIHYTKGDYSAAVSAFRTLLSKYPKGSKAPDALLKAGYAFLALKDKDSARTYLKRVVVEYPFSTSGAKAEKVLNSLDENTDN